MTSETELPHDVPATQFLENQTGENYMANQLSEMSESVAATLISEAYIANRGDAAYKTSRFTRKKSVRCDIIADRIHLSSDQYAAFTFWAVKKNKAKSATRALGGAVLADVVGRLLDHGKEEMSAVYSMASAVSGAMDAGGGGAIDTGEIYAKATKLGGEMQLGAAKRMGKRTYDAARVWGLIAERYHGGVVRFEAAGAEGLNIVLRMWQGSNAASWLDDFQGPRKSEINNLHNWGGSYKGEYYFDAATGDLS